MDDILERAKKRMHELRERQQKLARLLSEVERELDQFENFFLVANKLGAKTPAPTVGRMISGIDSPVMVEHFWPTSATARAISDAARAVTSTPFGSKTKVITEFAEQIIRDRGASTTRKILEALDERGIGQSLVPGRDDKGRIGYLSAILSKDERFESDREAGGYVLRKKEEAPPAAGQEGRKDGNDLM